MIINYLVSGNTRAGAAAVAAVWRRRSRKKMKREKRNEIKKFPTFSLSRLPRLGRFVDVMKLEKFFASFSCQTFRSIDCLNGSDGSEDVDEKFSSFFRFMAHRKKGKLALQMCNKNEIASTQNQLKKSLIKLRKFFTFASLLTREEFRRKSDQPCVWTNKALLMLWLDRWMLEVFQFDH